MPPTPLDIVARPMSRTTRSTYALLAMLTVATGCKELDARSRIRTGNRMFKEADYQGAIAEYKGALAEIDAPAAHYNLGLTYTKIFKAGDTSAENKAVAENIATEFNTWLIANPTDTPTRDLMTQVWIDAGEFDRALAYWADQLKAVPGNVEIMGKLAGISLKAGKWRDSMDWYTKVADAQPENSGKVLAFQSIGNVAWAKLNSNAVNNAERVEIADRGIGALEHAVELSPTNLRNHGLIASIYNFRSLAHGASWAGAIDRATSQDHSRLQRVLVDEAKKAQALENPTPPSGSGAPSATGAGSGSAASPLPPLPAPTKVGG